MADFKKFQKFVQLTKVDEAKREVGGIVTAEVEDKDGEVCHYDSTKSYYEAWSEEMLKASDGKNCGNLREMHGLTAAGVGKAIDFRDESKEIFMTFKVVDDAAWTKVQEGVYTGFSQGGEYVSKWVKGNQRWYTASPSEVSLVDNPCLGVAHFDFIRADGTKEIRKFKQQSSTEVKMATTAVAPAIDGELLAEAVRKELAKARKAEEAAAAKVAADVRLKKFCEDQSQLIIDNTAKKIGVVIEKTDKGSFVKLRKGMYEVGTLARMLCDLCYLRINQTYEQEYEQDNSKIPDQLQANLESLAQTFLAMAKEETQELLTSAAEAGKEGGELAMSTQSGSLIKAAKKSLADHLKKMADAVSEHHEKVHKAAQEHCDNMTKLHKGHMDKMHKLHKGHADEMSDHIQKLHKILGDEDDEKFAGDVGEIDPIEPSAAGAAPNLQAAAGLDAASVKKMIDEAVAKANEDTENRTIEALVKALQGDAENAGGENRSSAVESGSSQHVVKTQAGIGDRASLNRGPVVRVMPVTKAQDDVDLSQAASVNEVVDMEKVRRGDPAEVKKFMRGVKAGPLPNTLTEVVARAGGSR